MFYIIYFYFCIVCTQCDNLFGRGHVGIRHPRVTKDLLRAPPFAGIRLQHALQQVAEGATSLHTSGVVRIWESHQSFHFSCR